VRKSKDTGGHLRRGEGKEGWGRGKGDKAVPSFLSVKRDTKGHCAVYEIRPAVLVLEVGQKKKYKGTWICLWTEQKYPKGGSCSDRAGGAWHFGEGKNKEGTG